jgi:hypothetical protein
MLKQVYLKATTLADGTADVTEHQIVGLVHSIEVFASGLDATPTITVSITDTGAEVDKTLLTITGSDPDDEFFVRELEHGPTGTPLATTTKPAAVGKPRLQISSGGDTKTAKVVINYHDP